MKINTGILSDRFTGRESVSLKKRMRIARANGAQVSVADLIDESNLGEPIQIQLENRDTNASHTVAIFAGSCVSVDEIAELAGERVDAIVAHGEFLADADENVLMTCDCPKLAYIQKHFEKNPTRIDALQLGTDNAAQFGQKIKYARFSAIKGNGYDEISPRTYLTQGQLDRTMVEIKNRPFILDDKHLFIVTVAAGRTLDITMMVGASFDAGEALKNVSALVFGE